MFEKLGFKKITVAGTISFSKDRLHIDFDTEKKNVTVRSVTYSKHEYTYAELNIDVLQAMFNQLKELGWIE